MKRGVTGRQKTALSRINVLFEQAELRPKFSKRYVSLARRMSSRHKVSIPIKWRRRFCKECSAFWISGRTCSVRKRVGRLVYTCLECGSVRRFEVKK